MSIRRTAVVWLVLSGCVAHSYPMNLEPRLDLGPQVVAVATRVKELSEQTDSVQARRGCSLALLSGLPDFAPPSAHEAASEVLSQLSAGDVVSCAHALHQEGKELLHEITAGALDVPLDELAKAFPPAASWGRNLDGYLGGDLAVDQRNETGAATLQRERMVLTTPWYAVGAPDLDMSKYEVVDYSPRGVTVYWTVTKSGNASVHRDDGYLSFLDVTLAGRRQTLVLFDSIHGIDPGWLGSILPSSWQTSIALRSLRDMFSRNIVRYRAVVEEARRGHGGR